MKTGKATPAQKLEALRAQILKEGLDGFLVPRVDKYQGEFVAPDAERLAWLTGFTGSAGTAVVLKDQAVILTDGRYTIQLAQQADKALYKFGDSVKISPAKWLAEEMEQGAVIGYDPWLHTPKQIEAFEKTLTEKMIRLKAVENLIDRIWKDRPAPPMKKAEVFPEDIAGTTAARKKEQIRQALQEKGAFATVLNMPDSLMWLLNVRGGDMEETPVVLSLGIVYADAQPVKWFVDPAKITLEMRRHIGNAVEVIEPRLIEKHIAALAAESKKAGKPVAVDFARAPLWFRQKLEDSEADIIDLKDPCILPKSLKTPSEQDSIRKVHILDGVAMVKFLAWLEGTQEKLNEVFVGEKLEGFRKEEKTYRGPSFSSIVGFGSNGAIVHYRASPETSKKIEGNSLLLIDSGGQYHYGTTDITRTVSIGEPTEEMRKNFTLVLKGHIAVASAKFPVGTTGMQLDSLARGPLKEAGLDYAHGTGHGVGCYLSVHEEAAHMSTRGQDAVQAGMLLSNEPGYYKEGHYGIRIENLVLAQKADEKTLCFETVTLAPIDRLLIVVEMLTAEEKTWLNFYHAEVYKILAPLLDKNLKAWLETQTLPL
jgi:Xaa-Pro aminopeptidase